jgi:hypothetical protein
MRTLSTLFAAQHLLREQRPSRRKSSEPSVVATRNDAPKRQIRVAQTSGESRVAAISQNFFLEAREAKLFSRACPE